MKDKQEVIRAWLDTLRTADEALRLAGAGQGHRENLRAMQYYFKSKLKKAGAEE